MKFFHVFVLIITVVFIAVGCDEGMNMTKPVIMGESDAPAEQPADLVEEPVKTTMGDMKDPETQEPQESTETPEEPIKQPMEQEPTEKPEEEETQEPEEQEVHEVEQEQEPEVQEPETPEEEALPATDIDISTILPPEHVRRKEPLQVSDADLAIINFELKKMTEEGYEELSMQPNPDIPQNKAADWISLLPLSERQEAYNNFIRYVDLPHFIEASNRMVKLENRLAEAFKLYVTDTNYSDEGYKAYWSWFDREIARETGSAGITAGILTSIYYRANPEDALYPLGTHQGNSQYWMILEFIRLRIQYPEANSYDLRHTFYRHSAEMGWILGLDNPTN